MLHKYNQITTKLYSEAALKSLMTAGSLYADVSVRSGEKLHVAASLIDTEDLLSAAISGGYSLLVKQ